MQTHEQYPNKISTPSLVALPPEVRRDSSLSGIEIEKTPLEDSIIAIRNGHIAKKLLIQKGVIERKDADSETDNLVLRDLYSDDQLIFDADLAQHSLSSLSDDVLQLIHLESKAALGKLHKQKQGVLEQVASLAKTSSVTSREDYIQEGFVVLLKVALKAPNSENFDGYLRTSLRNTTIDFINHDEKDLANSRPLVAADFEIGARSDRFLHPNNAGDIMAKHVTRKLVDRTNITSSAVMHDLPSAEEKLWDESEKIRSENLINVDSFGEFLSHLPYFQETKYRKKQDADLNKYIMLATLFPDIVDSTYTDSRTKRSKTKSSLFDVKLGYTVIPPETIEDMRTGILSTLENDGLHSRELEVTLQKKLDRKILNRVWQYRKLGRESIINFLYEHGYSKNKDQIDGASLLDAIEDTIQ